MTTPETADHTADTVPPQPGPDEVFARMAHGWVHPQDDPDLRLLTEDAVIELPFAGPGRPSRFEGREAFRAFAASERGAMPLRLDEVRDVAILNTADPAVIVVEYESVGTLLATGRQVSARFIGVLRAREGKVAAWREYQDTRAIIAALQP